MHQSGMVYYSSRKDRSIPLFRTNFQFYQVLNLNIEQEQKQQEKTLQILDFRGFIP
jgi:hypothetical protein